MVDDSAEVSGAKQLIQGCLGLTKEQYFLIFADRTTSIQKYSRAGMDDGLRYEGMVLQQQMDNVTDLFVQSEVLYGKGQEDPFPSPVLVCVLPQTDDLQYLLNKVNEERVL